MTDIRSGALSRCAGAPTVVHATASPVTASGNADEKAVACPPQALAKTPIRPWRTSRRLMRRPAGCHNAPPSLVLSFEKRAFHEHPVFLQIQPGRAGHRRCCWPRHLHAQTQPAAMGASEWKTALTLYAYLPTIGGSTSFPTLPGNPSPSISVDGSTIIDHLKMTFMGSLDIHNGKWGAFTDILYVDIGGNKSKTRDFSIDGAPGTLSGDLSLDVKGTLWTLAGEYRMATSDPAFTVDVLAGARMFNMKNTLGWNFTGTAGSHPLAGRSGSTAVSDTLWDAIVGVKGNYTLRRRAAMVSSPSTSTSVPASRT
ncbi:hypothetical protein [Candidatus Skiveiella danica]|uniref:hypothetical protein n=1 Tax=Candidatus Skiveiella danica TaxID=3386177 RepID=UPI001D2CA441|nr:hypothetical protein [Betaproteobacteria bacterium]